MSRVPNPHSPEEVRRAFQELNKDISIITDGALGEVLVGAGVGNIPTWTTSLTTLTLLTVDSITVNAATITSSTGVISFDNENLTTTGTIAGVNVTSGANPGHTHTITSLTIDHDDLPGLGDDDHTQYSLVNGTRAFTGTIGGITPVASTDLTTKLYVDTAVASAVPQFDAIVDSNVVIGYALYVETTGHYELAAANNSAKIKVVGLSLDTASAAATITCQLSGPFTLADWTSVIGSASLSKGTIYYLKEVLTGYEIPSYSNPGGSGNRTSIITVTSTLVLIDPWSNLVNGSYPSNVLTKSGGSVAGYYLRFDFGSSLSQLIIEAKWYQDGTDTLGTWKWQGSNDASLWTDIGNAFVLGGAATQTQTELSGNTVGYRYYQLLGVSGTWADFHFIQEVEFKIGAAINPQPGMLTSTAPTSGNSFVVPVGIAISATTMKIQTDLPYLLR